MTASPTPTPSPTSTPACGDGIVDPATEECDDGNFVPEDGCDPYCRSELVPGGGPARTDCLQEWLTDPVSQRRRSGMPTDVLFCHDDDPTCDFGTAGDGACTFHVALCLNVAEYRPSARGIRGACQPSDVAWVAFKSPRELDPRDATEVANRDQLEAVVSGAGAVVRRQCEPPAATGTACTVDADCERPRRCRSRFLLFQPPLQTIGACTSFANVVVPLPAGRPGAPGRTTLRVTVGAATDARERDSDVLKLVCLGHAAPP